MWLAETERWMTKLIGLDFAYAKVQLQCQKRHKQSAFSAENINDRKLYVVSLTQASNFNKNKFFFLLFIEYCFLFIYAFLFFTNFWLHQQNLSCFCIMLTRMHLKCNLHVQINGGQDLTMQKKSLIEFCNLIVLPPAHITFSPKQFHLLSYFHTFFFSFFLTI